MLISRFIINSSRRATAIVASKFSPLTRSITTSAPIFHRQRPLLLVSTFQQQRQPNLSFSTNNSKVVDVRRGIQRDVWHYVVKTGGNSGVDILFEELDTDFSGTIGASELKYFLDSVNNGDKNNHTIKQDAIDLLLKLGEDHQLNEVEFRQWLSMALPKESTDNVNEVSSSSTIDEDEETSNNNKVSAVQSLIWDEYISGNDPINDAKKLFDTIDLNSSRTISVEEISTFLDSIDRKNINEDEVTELVQLGIDHELSFNEFSVWLAGAVNVDGDQVTDSSSRTNAEGCTPA